MKSKYFILTICAISVMLLLFSFAVDIQAQVVPCSTDADCDDGIFCNGIEFCLAGFCAVEDACTAVTDGCVTRGFSCDEDNDICVDFADDSLCAEGEFCDIITGACVEMIPCSTDADCDDGVFCNGTEFCSGGFCAVVDACAVATDGCVTRGFSCDEDNDICVDFADDSLCAEGEFCDIVTGACIGIQTSCGMVQLIAQEAVASGAPYKNHGQMVKTAAHAANPYLYDGVISEECHSCIVSQFARRISVQEQQSCE